MPLRLRPDKSKVVISGDGDSVTVHCDPSQSGAWQRGAVAAILKALANGGKDVVVNNGIGQHFLVKDGRAVELVISAPDGSGVQKVIGFKT